MFRFQGDRRMLKTHGRNFRQCQSHSLLAKQKLSLIQPKIKRKNLQAFYGGVKKSDLYSSLKKRQRPKPKKKSRMISLILSVQIPVLVIGACYVKGHSL